jgi:hypothetical protein
MEFQMSDTIKPYTLITDYVTGKEVPNIGAEENRQAVERFLVEKGGATLFMAIKCAAGSLGSREREIVAAARLFDENYQIPISAVSDGNTATVLDTVSGKKIGQGLEAIPSKKEAIEALKSMELIPFPKERLERERLIFRTYDNQNVNVQRNL